jgi:hypothetical protein
MKQYLVPVACGVVGAYLLLIIIAKTGVKLPLISA